MILFRLLFLYSFNLVLAQNTVNINAYHYSIDLNHITKDHLAVALEFSQQDTDTLTFCLPKIIPGIYDATNFGKYVRHFQAFDKNGASLSVNKIGVNCWEIYNAKILKSIKYNVSDGWDVFDATDLRPYRSAESAFNSDNAILSAPSIYGYFKGYKKQPFKISISKPKYWYGATSLKKLNGSNNIDEYSATDYDELVDHPMLYAESDIATIQLPNILVDVACYSSTHKKMAAEVAQYIAPLLKAQTNYLGGKLPVNRYTFLLYHNNNKDEKIQFSEGLEHSSSTLVLMYLPDDINAIKETVYHTASHEFFHNIMPIALHSHEIEDFNYNKPKFSKHLWLYEGMTEYFTIHMPIKERLHTLEQFILNVETKIKTAKQYSGTLSLLDLSQNPIVHQDQYMNVYNKGTLFNLCLDIQLREWSKGTYGVQNLIADLTSKYGPDKPFDDEKLFQIIVETTGYNELYSFFREYLISNKPLPLKEQLAKVGFNLNTATGKINLNQKPSKSQEMLRGAWIHQ